MYRLGNRLVGAVASAALVMGAAAALARATPPSGAPRVGRAQKVDAGGARLSVTVLKLVNIPSSAGASLLPGFRAVGVEVEIASTGPAIYDSSGTADFSIVATLSNATVANVTSVYIPAGICKTQLRDFDNYITAGEYRSGCVAFAIPAKARVSDVRFSPHGKSRGRLTWRV